MRNSDLKEKQRLEAVQRMKLLHIHENAIEDFLHGVLNCSEYGGILYWLSADKEALVREFERWSGGLVYHLIENHTDIGTMVTMLYVSKYEEEWEMERIDLAEDGFSCAYVENLTYPDCSEGGGVMVKPMNGGVIRVA